MKKQLLVKTFRAVLALVMFAGAVTMASAQALPSSSVALQLLGEKLERFSTTEPSVAVTRSASTLTATEKVTMYRKSFYTRIARQIRENGLSVQNAIDEAHAHLAGRNQAAANTLRQEVILYLTKS